MSKLINENDEWNYGYAVSEYSTYWVYWRSVDGRIIFKKGVEK